MKRPAWEAYFYTQEKTFYTEFIVLLASFFLLFILIKNFKKEKFTYLFLLYTISCLILFLGHDIQRIFFPAKGKAGTIITETFNNFFAVVEFCVFITFFVNITDSRNSKRLLLFFSGGFVLAFMLFINKVLDVDADMFEILTASVWVNIIEFSVFLIAILAYFIELFKKPPTKNLANSPAFWISCGLFIYVLVSLPMLLFTEYIWTVDRRLFYLLFSFHFLSFSLFLFTIAKAFLCRQPITA